MAFPVSVFGPNDHNSKEFCASFKHINMSQQQNAPPKKKKFEKEKNWLKLLFIE
jgi:hypothetical protein